MDNQDPSHVFDRYYYAHGCGRPYQRDEEWLGFFDTFARKINRSIQPGSVLDAGCAWGFLVEGLRKNGVQAWGIDISDYAIQRVAPEIRPFCWVGSITEPFPQSYDLIVSIEVVEHLPKAESELAIENICRYTDDVLISSTPFDYKEYSHYNVQPPEYWAEQFALHGFFRDVDFDASFISPWAVRFRRKSDPTHRLIRDYERKYWLLWKENTDLRNLAGDMRLELSGNERQIHDMKLNLAEVLNSRSWRLIQKLQSLRLQLFPLGSHRERFVKGIFRRLRSGANPGSQIPDMYQSWIARTDFRPFNRRGAEQRRAASISPSINRKGV